MTTEKALGYDYLKWRAAEPGYLKVKVALPVAMYLAEQSPYPEAVKLGIMKQIANDKHVTLRQLGILLGWAADRAQR